MRMPDSPGTVEQLAPPIDMKVGKEVRPHQETQHISDAPSIPLPSSKSEITSAMGISSNQDVSVDAGVQDVQPETNGEIAKFAPSLEDTPMSIPIRVSNPRTPSTRYTLSFRGTYGAEIESKQVESPSHLGKGTVDTTENISPLELIWPIHLAVESWADFEKNKGKSVPPVTASGPYILKINSPAVIAAIQNTIEYYPGLNASLGSLTVTEPFMPLYLYKEELERYAEDKREALEENPDLETCEREKHLQEHIAPLFQFLNTRPELQQIKLEQERWKRGMCTFKMLWLLYKPGTFVYSKSPGNTREPEAWVIKSITGGGGAVHNESYDVAFWNVDINRDKLGRVQHGIELIPWDGECPIEDLTWVPVTHYKVDDKGEPTEEGEKLRQKLIDNGKLFVKQFKRPCLDFDGETSDGLEKITGRVIADPRTFWTYDRYASVDNDLFGVEPTAFLSNDTFQKMPACTCGHCSSVMKEDNQSRSKFWNFDGIESYANIDQEFDDLFFVCSHKIVAFVTGQRVWKRLHISGAREPNWDEDMIDTRLVIDQDNLRTIKALASRYTQYNDTDSEQDEKDEKHTKDGKDGISDKEKKAEEPEEAMMKPWQADFIERKGDNAIFLLHGRPGVGKTFTAECVSEYVRRPLLTLTVNDIGTRAEIVEKKLAQFFERAKIWGAVVLLDEADIYLEKRTLHDLERNGLVSAFLRSLEYFQGILFLTTNRVGTFDDAFLSRIHVAVHYEFEEKERTTVWKMFFEKLDELSDRIEVHESARGFVRHSEELKSLEWNGREIRNAIQTAVALAESEYMREFEERKGKKDSKKKRAVLKRDHLEQVVSMSRNFRQYLYKVHGTEPEKRAAANKERNEYVRRTGA